MFYFFHERIKFNVHQITSTIIFMFIYFLFFKRTCVLSLAKDIDSVFRVGFLAKIAKTATFRNVCNKNFYFVHETNNFNKPSRLKVCNVNEAYCELLWKDSTSSHRTNTVKRTDVVTTIFLRLLCAHFVFDSFTKCSDQVGDLRRTCVDMHVFETRLRMFPINIHKII